MNEVTFITGNQSKANFLAKFLNHPVAHEKVDLDEIQSLDLREITEHKVRQAYAALSKPVLVEDTALDFVVLGRLPGTFIKWFLEEAGNEHMCKMLNAYNDRTAIARVCFAYYDGKQLEFFVGELKGKISEAPRGKRGFGWDAIFIPDGSTKTYAEMSDEEVNQFSLRTTTVFPRIKTFLKQTQGS